MNQADFEDKRLWCIDCDREFIFNSGEQAFYYSKELSTPRRCPECRARRRRLLIPDRGRQ